MFINNFLREQLLTNIIYTGSLIFLKLYKLLEDWKLLTKSYLKDILVFPLYKKAKYSYNRHIKIIAWINWYSIVSRISKQYNERLLDNQEERERYFPTKGERNKQIICGFPW